MYCLFLVLSLILSLNASNPRIINITEDYELEEFLCSGTQLLSLGHALSWDMHFTFFSCQQQEAELH